MGKITLQARSVLRMRRSAYFKILSGIMVAVFPLSLLGAESTPSAMLYSHGVTMLNGSSFPKSSALFSGDLIQTGADSVANISAAGSTVLILDDSLVQYEGNGVKLEHGGVTISTSKLMATRIGDVTVSPVANVWTEFEVRDVDGTIRIAARTGDLTVSDGIGTTTLAQGQETTRDESQSQDNSQEQQKKKKKKAAADVPAASVGILNSPEAIGIAGGIILGGGVWVLIQGGSPVSPAKP
jgi:hypothetical protein